MNDMSYRPVLEPPDPAESFLRHDTDATQAQAAILLAIAWQITPSDAGALDEDVAEYVGVAPSYDQLQGARVSRPDIAARLGQVSIRLSSDERRQALFLRYREEPDIATAAALFDASLEHPDPLVRVTAAMGYLESGLATQRPLDILRRSAAGPDELVREVAQTSLARVAPEIQAEFPGPKYYPESGPSLETTLIVHGTFARTQSWWRPGGDFQTYLRDHVYADVYNAPDAFSWSGAYSDVARTQGAADLVQWISDRLPDGRVDDPVSIVAHSHGGSVAMLASWAPLSMERLVLLSCPVHRRYRPNFAEIQRVHSVRVHCDLVILADRGGQRFRDPQINENVLPIWFQHRATHDPDVWQTHNVPGLIGP